MAVGDQRAARPRRAPAAASLSPMQDLILALRAIMGTGIVVGLAYWGLQTADGSLAKIGLAIGAPVLGFGLWGFVDFHQAGRAAEPLRLVQELVISGLVALALWSAGQPLLGLLLAVLSVGYHALVYASGGRLLKSR
jgi:Protein of unknown function (DUF2568)